MVGYCTFNLHFQYCWWILHKNVSSRFLFIFSAFVSQSSIKDDEIFEPSSSSFSFMLRLIFSLLHQSAKFKLQNWTYNDIERKYPHIWKLLISEIWTTHNSKELLLSLVLWIIELRLYLFTVSTIFSVYSNFKSINTIKAVERNHQGGHTRTGCLNQAALWYIQVHLHRYGSRIQ